MKQIILHRPDDWHLHLRDGTTLKAVLPFSVAHFARALIMPNLIPPIVNIDMAKAYHKRIIDAIPPQSPFTPLMSLYLTEETCPKEIKRMKQEPFMLAVKLYPAGATTNSASGVRNFDKIRAVLDEMAKYNIPLCVHGEVTDENVDIFDREAVFLERVLDPLRQATPGLKVTLEHITTKDGVDYVKEGGAKIAGSITVHHLVLNRNHLLAGGIRPHYYCLPIIKRERHRQALLAAATSGEGRFFLGTDSAPHNDNDKESACGCAGCFSAPNALSCLGHIFEQAGALDHLDSFLSKNGAQHYGFAQNSDEIMLEKRDDPVDIAQKIPNMDKKISIFDPGFALHWHVVNKDNL